MSIVELKFWHRRNERISILGVADARIPLYKVELVDAHWRAFQPLTLEPGDKPLASYFTLVPKHAPEAKVDASVGSPLELQFRPSRGWERWARPSIKLTLELAQID